FGLARHFAAARRGKFVLPHNRCGSPFGREHNQAESRNSARCQRENQSSNSFHGVRSGRRGVRHEDRSAVRVSSLALFTSCGESGGTFTKSGGSYTRSRQKRQIKARPLEVIPRLVLGFLRRQPRLDGPPQVLFVVPRAAVAGLTSDDQV